jgi:hypothetical protein
MGVSRDPAACGRVIPQGEATTVRLSRYPRLTFVGRASSPAPSRDSAFKVTVPDKVVSLGPVARPLGECSAAPIGGLDAPDAPCRLPDLDGLRAVVGRSAGKAESLGIVGSFDDYGRPDHVPVLGNREHPVGAHHGLSPEPTLLA